MNALMCDKRFRIKQAPGPLFKADRTDRVSQEFVLYILNDYLGHVQTCVAETRKMLPYDDNQSFYDGLAEHNPLGFKVMSIVTTFDIRQLGTILLRLQAMPRDVSVAQLIPFLRHLFTFLIRVYYLGDKGLSRVYRSVYSYTMKTLVPADPEALKLHATTASGEWRYILDQLCTGLYPLLVRMTSPTLVSMHQLFYENGSRLLSWLGVSADEVLFMKESEMDHVEEDLKAKSKPVEPTVVEPAIPEEVTAGLEILDELFPEAGWMDLESLPDFCAYFQPILQFQDAFTQIAPDNPLHQTMILFWILEELFQGLRLIKFEALPPLSLRDDVEDINHILEDWILYQESLFDKSFSVELKAYTHQIYTQPDFNKSPYGRKLLSNMYTLIKASFLPYFDIQMYGTTRVSKDDRLPPLFIRVARLKRLLTRYHASIEAAPPGSEQDPEGRVPWILNPWSPYKFDIANSVSKRLDALFAGKQSHARTNALLIRYTLSILDVLDWWINSKESWAYREPPDFLYRVVEAGSAVPALGVKPRTDVDAIFQKFLKRRTGEAGL